MARRYHEIKGLAEYTAKTIVSDEQEWKKFLHTAGLPGFLRADCRQRAKRVL